MMVMWEFPKIRGTILGVPIIRTIVFWGLYWGTLIWGNYHVGLIRIKSRELEKWNLLHYSRFTI